MRKLVMMNSKNNIALIAKKKSFEEGEDEDLDYWMNVSTKDRVNAMFDWNRKVWQTVTGKIPNKIEKSGGKISIINLDKDDF
ncbi:MAG: hypothetical protein KA319_08930 [Ferruginibacter sp.]|nr:hypothetical protein [Ferruginibacter sp.]